MVSFGEAHVVLILTTYLQNYWESIKEKELVLRDGNPEAQEFLKRLSMFDAQKLNLEHAVLAVDALNRNFRKKGQEGVETRKNSSKMRQRDVWQLQSYLRICENIVCSV